VGMNAATLVEWETKSGGKNITVSTWKALDLLRILADVAAIAFCFHVGNQQTGF
jgi:hypothetical protein